MSEPKSVLRVVSEEFPDLKPEEAKQLVVMCLNWLTTVGSIASKRLAAGSERELLLEHRAQSIAFGVLSRMMSLQTSEDTDKIDSVTNILEAISAGSSPTPLGN